MTSRRSATVLVALLLTGLSTSPCVRALALPMLMQQEDPVAAPLPAVDPALLLPRPAELVPVDAVFLLSEHSTVIVDAGAAEAHPVATHLARVLRHVSGQDIPIQLGDTGDADFGAWVVRLRPERTRFGAQGYRLRIEPEQIRLVAATRAGLLAGLQTLRQLLPETGPRTGEPAREILLPCLRLLDAPRVPLRGLVLEIGTRVPEALGWTQLVTQLARHKLNRLHLVGRVEALNEDTLDALRDQAQRDGVTLVLGDAVGASDASDAIEATGADSTPGGSRITLTLDAPTSWAAATALPAIDGALEPIEVIEASAALDDMLPDGPGERGSWDAWLWPRLAALSEVAWTQPAARKDTSFPSRLTADLERLSADGIHWFIPAPTRTGTQRVFAESLEIELHDHAPLGSVHATTDGSAPTIRSPRVDRTLTVTETATVRARVFVDADHASAELSFGVRQEPVLVAGVDAPEELVPGVRWEAFAEDPGEVEVVAVAESVAEAESEPKPESESESEPKPESEPEPEAEPEPKPKPKPEPEAEPVPESEPVPVPEPAPSTPAPIAHGWAASLTRPSALPGAVVALRFRGWLAVDQTGVRSFVTRSAGRCVLVIGTGAAARRWELSGPAAVPTETVLGMGTHSVLVTWWPDSADDTLDIAWRRTDEPSAVSEALPLRAPQP